MKHLKADQFDISFLYSDFKNLPAGPITESVGQRMRSRPFPNCLMQTQTCNICAGNWVGVLKAF